MAEHEVLLYIYDLSQGMAASMSVQLTGRYIPGIWHTAVTIPDFGVEVFFGQGISIVPPGTSHHGQPHKTERMGSTSIDKETFLEYIEGVRELYSAERYHLLDFNCNNFTQDVCSFLTGKTIPSEISDLPKEFLSTPFGQSLRPMIENMYTGGYRPDAGEAVTGMVNNNAQTQVGPASTTSLTSPLSMCTNLSSFENLLRSNDCFVVMFTSQTCPPCRTIKPVFEDLALQSTPEPSSSSDLPPLFKKTVAFAVADTSIARDVASRCGVAATPTFQFYLKGSKVHELKGADAGELKMQTALLLDSAYPPHPHAALRVPELRRLANASASFDNKPNFEAALARLEKANVPKPAVDILRTSVVPWLSSAEFSKSAMPQSVSKSWQQAQESIFEATPSSEWFPSLDLLRFAATARLHWTAPVLVYAVNHLIEVLPSRTQDDKTWMLALRLFTNVLPSVWQASRSELTSFIIEGLLHAQSSVRTSSATCAFRAVQLEYARRPNWLVPSEATQEEWETEVLTACLESIQREENVETGHRLIATLGLVILLSPDYQTLCDLSQALGSGTLVDGKGKAAEQGHKKLVTEVLSLLDN